VCRHLQSALIKKIADGEYYVKEGLFSKSVGFRFFNGGRPHATRITKSFGSQFLQKRIDRPH
jgi:hypothetical protein